MHYYKHHIGDFIRDTSRLTDQQAMAYLRMLWLYYESEAPLSDSSKLAFKLGVDQGLVESILGAFFKQDGEVWRHDRCDREIQEYRAASKNHWASRLPRHVRTAIQAERNASKAQATPKWLTRQHRVEIAGIYAQAATDKAKTGIAHEVDHIVPLRSKHVCGLHVPWNLQVLPAYANRAKTNSFEAG